MADVQELVERAKAGDRQAFAGLYDQFAPLVRSVAYDTSGSLHEAEDLCQDVFLQAYRRLGQLRDAARFDGWLMMIARRACASWRRTRRRHTEVDIEAAAISGDPPEPVGDEIERLLDAMGRLPPKERMALHLFYLAEQPASLARQTMGLSSAGFYKILERAKRRVAALLEKREVT
jgi:RNA polymerase sigma-70 factor (ECF subfamily)